MERRNLLDFDGNPTRGAHGPYHVLSKPYRL
jgi:hypothetical protein